MSQQLMGGGMMGPGMGMFGPGLGAGGMQQNPLLQMMMQPQQQQQQPQQQPQQQQQPAVDDRTLPLHRARFANQLSQLVAMGFTNETVCLRALVQHDGRVDAAIDALLSMGDAAY